MQITTLFTFGIVILLPFLFPAKPDFKTIFKKWVFFFFIILITPLTCSAKDREQRGLESQINFKQGIFNFIVDPEVNTDKLAGKISLRKISLNLNLNKDSLPSNLSETQKNLFWKFYIVYLRVQNLLNMRPGKQNDLNIRIYHDSKTIRADLKMSLHSDAPAYYSHRKKTLFICAKKIDEFILAHEMAHVIICNYFMIEPPAQAQEILAIYCDSHLKDNSV